MKKRNGFVDMILLAVAAVILLFSLTKIFEIIQDYRTAEVSYEEAVDTYVSEPVEESEEEERIIDFVGLKAVNPDVIGWIELPDSKIDYPILRGTDNERYLNETYDGKYSSSGSIFMDFRCSFDSSNVVIYGHNMKNGSMFRALNNYVEEEFYNGHRAYKIYTEEDGCKDYEIISCYITDAYSDAYKIAFDGQEDYESWIEEIVGKSLYEGMEADAHKNVITLSTCRGTNSNVRFVVHLQEVDN